MVFAERALLCKGVLAPRLLIKGNLNILPNCAIFLLQVSADRILHVFSISPDFPLIPENELNLRGKKNRREVDIHAVPTNEQRVFRLVKSCFYVGVFFGRFRDLVHPGPSVWVKGLVRYQTSEADAVRGGRELLSGLRR